ncbi:MAG: hypothetical protein HYX53_06025 [Chloroflexi bacterium]|nr:hypothetical protein [Chloroflexota bacterium]
MLESCVQAANREAVIPIKELEEQQRRHREEVSRLTSGIRRIIEIIKSQDDLEPDLRAELKKLSEEKEQLGTFIEKLQMDIDHRRRRVLDVDLIRRNLVEFERLVNLMPTADQKELMQLLLNKVEVRPFDPERDELPAGSSGAFATQVRSKWFRVSVSLQQLPGLGLGKRHSGGSSDKRGSGSAFRDRSRIFLPVEVTLRVDCGKKRRAGEKRHYFPWQELPRTNETKPATPANPVRIAREWKRAMEERGESRAGLARRLGVSRARVSQVLGILDLAPDVLELLEQQSGPSMVSEWTLRVTRSLPPERQWDELARLLSSSEDLASQPVAGSVPSRSSGATS